MVLLLVPIVTLSQLTAHNRVDVVDDQMFGYFGWRIAHGAVPYKDVWDNKPPGIYWINALGFLIGGFDVLLLHRQANTIVSVVPAADIHDHQLPVLGGIHALLHQLLGKVDLAG